MPPLGGMRVLYLIGGSGAAGADVTPFSKSLDTRVHLLGMVIALAILAILAPGAAQAQAGKSVAPRTSAPASLRPATPLLAIPAITEVTPTGCVRIGTPVRLTGKSFGAAKPAAYTLSLQPDNGARTVVNQHTWASTLITFEIPEAPGLKPGVHFTAGIHNGTSFLAGASVTMSLCPAVTTMTTAGKQDASSSSTRLKRPTKARKAMPGRVARHRIPIEALSGGGNQPGGDAGYPEITAISSASSPASAECLSVGEQATAHGANLGISSAASSLLLGLRSYEEPPTTPIGHTTWSPTSISFLVPPEAGLADWFALGLVYEGTFYPQLYLWNCSSYSGEDVSDYGGYGYDSDEDTSEDGYQGTGAAGPKGARMLSPGAVDVQINAPPPSESAAAEPPPSGKRAVGGKILALKALSRIGLRKVNKECDILDPHCPCCRKDGTVCLEKVNDNDDGTSIWAVRWKAGAKTLDGRGAYLPRSAEDDVEAVTGLQCDLITHEAEGSAGVATLRCR